MPSLAKASFLRCAPSMGAPFPPPLAYSLRTSECAEPSADFRAVRFGVGGSRETPSRCWAQPTNEISSVQIDVELVDGNPERRALDQGRVRNTRRRRLADRADVDDLHLADVAFERHVTAAAHDNVRTIVTE